MLSVHGRRFGIPLGIAIPTLGMLAAMGAFVVGLLQLAALILHSGQFSEMEQFNMIWGGILGTAGGVVGVPYCMFQLRNIFYRGALQHALVANSRTLAIVRFRAPTVYIKYADCVAVKLYGSSVVLADGRAYPLECEGAHGRRVVRDFIEPLYALWWPHLDFKAVREELIERTKRGEKFQQVSYPVLQGVERDLECANAEY